LATDLGLPEIGIFEMRKSGRPDLRVRDAPLRGAPHHEAETRPHFNKRMNSYG